MTTPRTPAERSAQAEAPALAACFEVIFAGLLHHIAAAFRPLGHFTAPAWTRISRTRMRLARLLALLAVGRLPRIHPPRARTANPSASGSRGGPPAPYLPRRPGWLSHVAGYQLRGIASQLNHLLHQPETQATLAAAPPELRAAIARTLKTTARLLGITLPDPLHTTPKPKPRRAAPPVPVIPDPPLRPLPAYVRAAVRAWKPRYG